METSSHSHVLSEASISQKAFVAALLPYGIFYRVERLSGARLCTARLIRAARRKAPIGRWALERRPYGLNGHDPSVRFS